MTRPEKHNGERLGWRTGELSRVAGIPRSTLSDLIAAGALVAVRLGTRGLWISRDAWAEYCAKNSTRPGGVQ